jgi:uncharacterized protein (TIGR02145 family)
MKKYILLLLLNIFIGIDSFAQNDYMYFMKNGLVVGKFQIDIEVDSIIFYNPIKTLGFTFIDPRDNTSYQTVKIGNKTWMAENLKYLPKVDNKNTTSSSLPCYYVYNYDGTDVSKAKATLEYSKFGVMYNWQAAINQQNGSNTNPSGVQGACPVGWHLPSDAEWKELFDTLGGVGVAAGKLKEAGYTNWLQPNSNATNESGFSALPGGYILGSFYNLYMMGSWWSATDFGTENAMYVGFNYNNNKVTNSDILTMFGFSVRCVKDD